MSRKGVKLTERKSSLSCDEFLHEISSCPIKIIVWAILGWEDSPMCSFPLYNFTLLQSHTSGYLRSIKASSSLLEMYLKVFVFSPYPEEFQVSKDSFWYCWNALFLLVVKSLDMAATRFWTHRFMMCFWHFEDHDTYPVINTSTFDTLVIMHHFLEVEYC